MKSSFLTRIAVAGYVLCLAVVMLPGLNLLHPTGGWFGMAVCAAGAWMFCGSHVRRGVAVVALVIGLVGGGYCWEKNRVLLHHIHEHAQPMQPPLPAP
jgi:hypothetical protein